MSYDAKMPTQRGAHVDRVRPRAPRRVQLGCISCGAGPFHSEDERRAHVDEVHLSCKPCGFLAPDEYGHRAHMTSRRHEETIAYGAPRATVSAPRPAESSRRVEPPLAGSLLDPSRIAHPPRFAYPCTQPGCEHPPFASRQAMNKHRARVHGAELVQERPFAGAQSAEEPIAARDEENAADGGEGLEGAAAADALSQTMADRPRHTTGRCAECDDREEAMALIHGIADAVNALEERVVKLEIVAADWRTTEHRDSYIQALIDRLANKRGVVIDSEESKLMDRIERILFAEVELT